MTAEGGVIITFVFTGEEERNEKGRHIIPQNVTHLLFHESVTAIPGFTFQDHPNIVEVYCHVGVKRIEMFAFYRCPRLKRLIIPGVEVVGECAFDNCKAVTDVECPKLEIIDKEAFYGCESLGKINLPSANIVCWKAFCGCSAMTEAKFGKNLEFIGGRAFSLCHSLERITLPLRNDVLTHDAIFKHCNSLKRVDLVEREVLRETVATLQMKEWIEDMNGEIDLINQILPNVYAGIFNYEDGEKDVVIQELIGRVLRRIIAYKAQHRHLLNEAAATLQLVLPEESVINSVLPFLELPPYEFDGEGEDHEEE